MTPSLALLAAVPLAIGLTGAPLTSATTAPEHGRGLVGAGVVAAALPRTPARPAGTTPRSTVHTAGKAFRGSGGAGGPDIVEHAAARSAAEQRRVLGYWTPRRMARAVPLGLLDTLAGALGPVTALTGRPGTPALGPVTALTGRPGAPGLTSPARRRASAPATAVTSGARWTAGGAVRSTTGRVFLTLGGVDFVCSASSVRSGNRDLVVTAGHCVKDGAGAWAENWTFVPGYDQGSQPYGRFTARRMFVAGPWSRSADDSHDLAMVALNTRNGRHLADVVGAQEIAFGAARGRHAYGFGFPVDPPYDGEHMIYCAGPVREDPYGQTRDQGLRCNMTAGSSGGPWFSSFDPATGRGTITSVSSFKYSDDHGTMYGPYFGDTAKELYLTAQRS
ncbi:serine protease [Planomonospora sp. ID82291]|uniref:trypsin-like serine peptidase n=1 Tax=Planomonospora sp. ID82291 TaxID=2738136 RepID=UPI0018C43083|nr:trypsin-like peptidase domain-containing protein [Planomonospora sp. ID82291]MBG0815809.1 trypsin-like peptidase domain-containing protein [Planomonospora sp. ID82291]